MIILDFDAHFFAVMRHCLILDEYLEP